MVLGFNIGNKVGKQVAGITSIGDQVDRATNVIGDVSPIDLDKTAGDFVERFTGNKDLGDDVRRAGETIDRVARGGGESINEARDEVVRETKETAEEVRRQIDEFSGGALDTVGDAFNGLESTADGFGETVENYVKNPTKGGEEAQSFVSEHKSEIIISGASIIGAYLLNKEMS